VAEPAEINVGIEGTRSPTEPYPGPDPYIGGQPPRSAQGSTRVAAPTRGRDVVIAGNSVAAFGPLPKQVAEPPGPRDMIDKHSLITNKEPIDAAPPGQPRQPPAPAWAVPDYESESHPKRQSVLMPDPLSHDPWLEKRLRRERLEP
jgi:hypothetical protein